MRRTGWIAVGMLAAAGSAAAVVVLVSGSDGGDQAGAGASGSAAPAVSARGPAPARSRPERDRTATEREVHAAVARSRRARLDRPQRRVARVAGAYIEALDAHDGAGVCGLFIPGALAAVRFPNERSSCAASVSASIGYRDPRGFPVFARARIARVRSIRITGADARVVATTVTRFAGHREPSVEDDLIYLGRRQGKWLIAKPDVALYRAIGVGGIPPRVLTPP